MTKTKIVTFILNVVLAQNLTASALLFYKVVTMTTTTTTTV